MIIHSNASTSKVDLPPSVLDMVSERSSRAMYKANRNESAIKSDESAIRTQSNQISAISNELPKSQSKKAYIDDTYVDFPKYYDGNILSACITDNGESIPTSIEMTSSAIRVKFDALTEVATVTITII